MGRYADANSGTSSFSILLNDAPHLDMQVSQHMLPNVLDTHFRLAKARAQH